MVYDYVTLKKVIRKIETLNDTDKQLWLDSIISKLYNNKCDECFTQGVVEGMDIAKHLNSKVVIPDYVANWLEYCKSTNVSIRGSLVMNELFLYNYARKSDVERLKIYFTQNSNQLLFVNAWVNGYTIKKEKHYYVAIPIENGWYRRLVVYSNGKVGLDDHNYMSLDKLKQHSRQAKYQLTEKMIKESALSWAWQFAKELED